MAILRILLVPCLLFAYLNSSCFSLTTFNYPELLKTVNLQLDPCHDFYGFICDGFQKQAKLRSECMEISNSATRKWLVQSQLQSLLSDGNARTQALNGPLAGIYEKMFTFHGLCLEWPRRDMLGSEALLAKLQTLNSGGQRRRQFDTEWAIRAFPTGAFFQLFPLIDTRKGRNSAERKIIGLRPKPLISSQADWNSNGQGNTLMGSRFGQIMHALLEDDIWRALRQNTEPVLFPFTNYILQGEVSSDCLRVNCPMSDRLIRMLFAEAERRVRNLLIVEQRLARNFDTDPLYDGGPLAHQTFLRLAQLDQMPNSFLPNFNWTIFLQSILAPIGRRIGNDKEIHVSEPGLLQRLATVIKQLGSQQMADYLDWQLVWAFLPQMDQRYTRPYVNLNKMKDSLGVRKCPLEKRWMQIGEKCEKFLEWYFPHLLDSLYIQHHMGKSVREGIQQIYKNIYNSFKQMLHQNTWMDTGTKQNSLAKLEAMQANAVYFDQIFDNNLLARLYAPYEVLRTDVPFALIVHQLEGMNFLRQMATNNFYDPSWGVNAYYSRENNALVALNGYLHPPIFSPSFPAALNYAGIGSTLGHELSHGFDDWGSYYNDEGRQEDWLGPTMRRRFQERKQCFVQQYGANLVQVEGTTLHVNGSLTVNENIADNGGLAAAFHAWQSLRSTDKTGDLIATKVQGLEQFNGDQLFFIHYAFRQCARMGSVWLRQRLLVGQHSVVPARVNVPLQNLPQFAAIFNCPLGSPMNPNKRCTIW